jgi:hypothetical protein
MRKLVLLALTAAVQLVAGDPRIGTWKLVDAHSAADPPRKLTVTSQGDSIHVVISGGAPVEFTAKWDGHGYPVPGVLAFNQIVVRRISKTRAELIEKKDGIIVATVREQLSGDGKELEAITSRKGHDDQISVLDRTGGITDAENPFAGEWTENLSKSRLRQGLVLKITPDGQGGVRYAGEFRYEAKFDGKDYAVTNSRDDTVALKLIDAHTVESIYKRDEQVTDRDRWVLSNDGQQLTVTMTGTSETGERIREDLVFRKQ